MIKKRQIFLLLSLMLTFTVTAGAITDDEILKQAIAMQQQGISETEMGKALLAKGATIEQLQRLKEKMAGGTMQKTASATPTAVRRENPENVQMAPDETWFPKSRVYGGNVFRTKGLSFEPQMNMATPQNYVLGPGDQVIIDIYGASQLQLDVTISPEGMVTVDDYGPVKLAGLTVAEALRKLKGTVGLRYQNSQLMLSLGQIRSISVDVLGEVNAPGTYQLSSLSTVFHALYVAGGINDIGTLRDIKLYRDSKEIASIDVYDYLKTGDMKGNVRLQDGDVVMVQPFASHVFIGGKVKLDSLTFEMKKGETMDRLLYYAGGFAAEAYTSAVRVSRNNGNRSVITVKNEQFDKFVMMDSDSVSVEAIVDRLSNTVSVEGAVFRPGQYGLSANLRTVSQLIAMADGPIETAFLKRAVLYRLKLDRSQYALPIDLEAIMNGSAPDVELKNEDKIYVPDTEARLKEQTVTIFGEVREPQVFPYAENETVEDLILRAGGLTKRASTSKVDIVRRFLDPKATEDQDQRSETFTVSIDDSMHIDGNGFKLEPFDEVYVRTSPVSAESMTATITGEAVFEGTYELQSKVERLSDLVSRGGGLTKYAYLQGARLTRMMNDEEKEKLEMLKEKYADDTTTLKTLDLDTTYLVGIDLAAALATPGCEEDIILCNGDILSVPTKVSTVKISGDVLYPNAVSFVSGKKAGYYIRQSGGYGDRARRSKVYIIYPGGKTKLASEGTVVAGSEIVVPSKPDKKNMTTAERVSIATSSVSLASAISSIVMVINNLTK